MHSAEQCPGNRRIRVRVSAAHDGIDYTFLQVGRVKQLP
jgi:hypothetical protein